MEASGELLRFLALAAGAAGALAAFSVRTRATGLVRFAAALAIGTLACHVGGGWLSEGGLALPRPGAQTSLLFLPLGLLATLPKPRLTRTYLDAAAPALAIGIATARLGCIAAGCCIAWVGAIAEIVGWVLIAHAGFRSPTLAAALFAIGGGSMRFALLPLREGSAASASELALASCWILVGVLLWLAASRSSRPTGPAEVAVVVPH